MRRGKLRSSPKTAAPAGNNGPQHNKNITSKPYHYTTATYKTNHSRFRSQRRDFTTVHVTDKAKVTRSLPELLQITFNRPKHLQTRKKIQQTSE